MKSFFTVLFLMSGWLAQAQWHDNNWIFGYDNSSTGYDSISSWGGVRMHFEAGFPQFSLENIRSNYSIYSGVCSDSSGNLLFHTEGLAIRNRLHQKMENGDTINPGFYWNEFHNLGLGYPGVSGASAIPAPGFHNCYYLFHSAVNDDPESPVDYPVLYYSFIDMNANNGLGKVLKKNVVIAQGNVPYPILIKHGNGRDWWLLIPDYLHKTCHTYLITGAGIIQLSDQDIVAEMLTATVGYSYIDVSPDGLKFACNDSHAGLWIFDIDRCTGELSNPSVVHYPHPFYTSSVSFEGSNRFLYLSTDKMLYQLDIEEADTATYIALDTIAHTNYAASPYPPYYTFFFLPQLAPDGKIYNLTFNTTMTYHVVNRPDLPAEMCDFQQKGAEFTRFRDMTWCHFPDYRTGVLVGSNCDTLNVTNPNPAFKNTKAVQKKSNRSDKPRELRLAPSFYLSANEGLEMPEDVLDMQYQLKERKKLLSSPELLKQRPRKDE